MYNREIEKLRYYLKDSTKAIQSKGINTYLKTNSFSCKEDLLKLCYIKKYAKYLEFTGRITDIDNLKLSIDNLLFNRIKDEINTINELSDQTRRFLNDYSAMNKNLLQKVYNEIYLKSNTETQFKQNSKLNMTLAKVFLLNNFNNLNFEFPKHLYTWTAQEIANFLSRSGSVSKILVFDFIQRESKLENKLRLLKMALCSSNQREAPTTTKTQNQLDRSFRRLGIKYNAEYKFKYYDYVFDYYLPKLNMAVEYLGPDHFYPLQSQMNQKSKFKISNLINLDQRLIYADERLINLRVICIPYWEWSKLGSEMHCDFYIKRKMDNYAKEMNDIYFKEGFKLDLF